MGAALGPRAPDQLCAIASRHKDRTFLVLSTPGNRSWHALRPEMVKPTRWWPKTASSEEALGTLETAATRRARALRGHRVI